MTPVAICLGGALSVWDDLKKAMELVKDRPHLIVAANHAGLLFPGDIDAWVTLHPELLPEWMADRKEAGFNDDYQAFVHSNRRKLFDVEEVPQRWSASSGIFAAQVALDALDCAGAILCGVPIAPEGGHIVDPGEWPLSERYRPGVLQARDQGAPIRSMSGWTAKVLGKPSKSWLTEIGVEPGRVRRKRKAQEPNMRISMLNTRNWTPPEDRRQTTKYLAGSDYTVKRSWGRAMVKDGDAVEVPAPPREANA